MKGGTWRMTNRIIDRYIKNIHNKEWPEWIDYRIKENSDLIINWFNKRSALSGWFVSRQHEAFEGDIIEIEGHKRKWVALHVTEWDIEHGGTDVEKPGLHAFGGMWYGDNALSIHSFGKILPLDGTEKVIGTVYSHPLATLKDMVD